MTEIIENIPLTHNYGSFNYLSCLQKAAAPQQPQAARSGRLRRILTSPPYVHVVYPIPLQIERVVPVAGSGELVNFQHLFFVKTRRNLSDSHLWFSVLQRPVRSRFTRVQRLTCCLVLLFTSMMASIMFYNKSGQQPHTKVGGAYFICTPSS